MQGAPGTVPRQTVYVLGLVFILEPGRFGPGRSQGTGAAVGALGPDPVFSRAWGPRWRSHVAAQRAGLAVGGVSQGASWAGPTAVLPAGPLPHPAGLRPAPRGLADGAAGGASCVEEGAAATSPLVPLHGHRARGETGEETAFFGIKA